jgi:hypothetical protein
MAATTTEKPWHDGLPQALMDELFPRGQADLDAFNQRQAEREAQGFPATCDDPEALLSIARICMRP